MKDYVILTDSSADLNPKLIEKLRVDTIPLQYEIDGKSYFDWADEHEYSIKDFYASLRAGNMSTTSQINIARFAELFESYAKNGSDVLYVAFSSGLSGTYNSAMVAAADINEKYTGSKIIVIDSLCASLGEGLLVHYASKNRSKGMTIEENAKWLTDNRLNLCHWFTVEDLNFLWRGGRVSKTTAFVGTMLSIKPVMHVDNEGHLIPMEKVRGRRQSLDALVNHMEKTYLRDVEQTVFISHGDCLEEAEYVAQQVTKRFGIKDIEINNVGPVIGAHSGPGTMALFFLGSQR